MIRYRIEGRQNSVNKGKNMADTKEFDVEQIKGSQFMDRQDRQYFERHGAAMSGQAEAMAEQYDIDPKEMNDTFDTLMESLIYNRKEYIVNRAPLQCSMQADEGTEQTLFYQGNKIISKPVLTADMSALQLPEERPEDAQGFVFANISDTSGGLREELVNEEGRLNIISFGNCKCIDEENITEIEEMLDGVCRALMGRYEYTGVTEEEMLSGILQALKQNKGTCFCCMVLNPEWENLPAEYDYVDNTFREEPMMSGIDRVLFADSYMQFNGKEGINMMSMLFCRYGGGTISAKESGQGNNRFEKLTEEEILFISTIYGEAGGCSTVAWEAIANVIMNRVNDRHWGADNTVTIIIDKSGFDAYTYENSMYKIAKTYLENRDFTNTKVEEMINHVMPIYRGETVDISNGATMYYSPNAQKDLHDKYPLKYPEKPNWNFSLLEEVKISGLENDDFLFYKYK